MLRIALIGLGAIAITLAILSPEDGRGSGTPASIIIRTKDGRLIGPALPRDTPKGLDVAYACLKHSTWERAWTIEDAWMLWIDTLDTSYYDQDRPDLNTRENREIAFALLQKQMTERRGALSPIVDPKIVESGTWSRTLTNWPQGIPRIVAIAIGSILIGLARLKPRAHCGAMVDVKPSAMPQV